MVSFFAPRNYLGCIIRGKQIADYLGGKYNKERGDVSGDVNIFIKPRSLDNVLDGDWVDVSDGEYVPELLKSRPKIRVIAHSLYSFKFLKKALKNEIIWISQQHCNWEKEHKEIKKIKTCGYIGGPNTIIRKQYEEIGKSLNKAGFEFITCFDFTTRESCNDFYKKIDVLIVGQSIENQYKTPTKLINAASFGIPSVAYPLKSYEEWNEYIPCLKDEDISDTVKNLQFDSKKLIEAADFYHISNVAKRYENLYENLGNNSGL